MLIVPLFTQPHGTYFEKLARQAEAESSSNNIWELVYRHLGANIAVVVFTFVIGYALSFLAGWGEALTQKEFLVTNTSPEMAVLRIYGDNVISAPFDRNTKKIEPRFVVRKLAESPELVLTLEEIGPLRPTELTASAVITHTSPIASPTAVSPTVVISPVITSSVITPTVVISTVVPADITVITSTNSMTP